MSFLGDSLVPISPGEWRQLTSASEKRTVKLRFMNLRGAIVIVIDLPGKSTTALRDCAISRTWLIFMQSIACGRCTLWNHSWHTTRVPPYHTQYVMYHYAALSYRTMQPLTIDSRAAQPVNFCYDSSSNRTSQTSQVRYGLWRQSWGNLSRGLVSEHTKYVFEQDLLIIFIRHQLVAQVKKKKRT